MTAATLIQSSAGTSPAEFIMGALIAAPLVSLFLWLAWLGRRRP